MFRGIHRAGSKLAMSVWAWGPEKLSTKTVGKPSRSLHFKAFKERKRESERKREKEREWDRERERERERVGRGDDRETERESLESKKRGRERRAIENSE